ncbi:hypothetical protein KC921_05285 [Candidatus Woesebacteria bacterium]|nr:hypothetical protein [Candidatus Woesebacteria bacterium]
MKVTDIEGRRTGYRVTTPDGRSLGLRNNPNIIDYTEAIEAKSEYKLPPENVVEGKADWGGIWVAPRLSDARRYVTYMEEKHGVVGCRIFLVTLGRVLYENSCRIKTDGITFVKEI